MKKMLNRQIAAMTEEEVKDMVKELLSNSKVSGKTGLQFRSNLGGGLDNSVTKEDEKLCKGVKVGIFRENNFPLVAGDE